MRFAHEYTDTDNRTVADVVHYQEDRIGAHARHRKLLEQRVIDLEEEQQHLRAELEELRRLVVPLER